VNEKLQLLLAAKKLAEAGNLDPTSAIAHLVRVSSQTFPPMPTLKYTLEDLLKSNVLERYLNRLQTISIKWSPKELNIYLYAKIEGDG
jgi:hypothetical protein